MLKVVEINVSTVPDAFISNITINQIDQLNNNIIFKLSCQMLSRFLNLRSIN
jgi:hypothetical protein